MYYVENYDVYYPRGGLNDLEGPYATFEEAEAASLKHQEDHVAIVKVENGQLAYVSEA